MPLHLRVALATLLGADPRNGVLALTQVQTTIRGGRILYDGKVPR